MEMPVKKHLDYGEINEEVSSEGPEFKEIKKTLQNFFNGLGFIYEDFVLGFYKDEENKIRVYIDIDKFENIPLLKGGKLLSIFQQMSERLPKNIFGENYEWMFIRQDKVHATIEINLLKRAIKKLVKMRKVGSAEMGLLNEALARLGDNVIRYGGVEAFLALDFVREITNNIRLGQEEKIRKLEEEVRSTEMFAPYRPVKY